MPQYRGATRKYELRASRRRKDTRLFGQKVSDFWNSRDGIMLTLFLLPVIALVSIKVPMSGELLLLFTWWFGKKHIRKGAKAYDFPYRVPKLADARDASTLGGKSKGKGITLLGNETDDKKQIYAGDSDLRTHMLVLGTTGSGKTEFLLGLVFNALVQNTGFIYVDGKGDPKLQKEIFRLCRLVGREDDLLIINFITSGRDFIEKQVDKVTNNMNIMGNSSSGMLIELIVSLMDDSGKGGGDMWKGRAISFVSALSRPLVYLRDKGFINLSPEIYLEYFELKKLEELVFEHGGKYGDEFAGVIEPLESYLITLPGYDRSKIKKQGEKTLEQHGYITMQLTRIFNDLNFNYGHIFKTRVGDIDFFDVVLNRRMLVVLLPALERAPDTLKMLGKLIVGSIKQMMAGCLGNRVEGVVREIIDSRPTNAPIPFYTILDEYGYYAVVGFAVAPAQARSLGFSVIFAAQDFSSLKKSSPEEADATWENTNIRAIGRLTSGEESETWKRISGASGEVEEARLDSFERDASGGTDSLHQGRNIKIDRHRRIEYDDLAMQENGEFTFLVGKKEGDGQRGGVRVIRGMGFYTASKATREMRLNDFLPIEPPTPDQLYVIDTDYINYMGALQDPAFASDMQKAFHDIVEDADAWARFVGAQKESTGNTPVENISDLKSKECNWAQMIAIIEDIVGQHFDEKKLAAATSASANDDEQAKRDAAAKKEQALRDKNRAFFTMIGIKMDARAQLAKAGSDAENLPIQQFNTMGNVTQHQLEKFKSMCNTYHKLFTDYWGNAVKESRNTSIVGDETDVFVE
ncbi:MAG: TraM recognition domain-containing protein [Actinomycetaceae bacterium]|nr:TraM recognition domain-containing protein [Actinomycetaceae bacterium]